MQYFKGPNEIDASFYYKWHSKKTLNNIYGNKMPVHIHQSAEILLVTNGKIEITTGDKPLEIIGENQAALIFPFQPHKYTSVPNTEYLRCNFASSIIPEFFGTNSGKEGAKSVFDVNAATIFHFKERILEKKALSIWNIRAFLYSAIDDFLSQIALRETSVDTHILTRAIAYMSEHKQEKLSVENVATAIGYSKSHLSFCINKAANFNFNTLLSILRIEDARIMLKNTEKSILEIAIECGFGSERSFYRQFKAISGVSPKDYRETTVFKTIEEPVYPKRSPK